jgi:hypothetical protein
LGLPPVTARAIISPCCGVAAPPGNGLVEVPTAARKKVVNKPFQISPVDTTKNEIHPEQMMLLKFTAVIFGVSFAVKMAWLIYSAIRHPEIMESQGEVSGWGTPHDVD